MSEWISVNDRLPENEQAVLVSRDATTMQLERDAEYCKICLYALDGNEGWYDFQTDEDENQDFFKITHWMPLPELPK
jgi:hypothetical protein